MQGPSNAFALHNASVWNNVASLCVQEEEAKLKPGTDKHIAFQCLKDAGAAGLNITQIIDAAKQNGVKDLDENSKRVIQYVSHARKHAIKLLLNNAEPTPPSCCQDA